MGRRKINRCQMSSADRRSVLYERRLGRRTEVASFNGAGQGRRGSGVIVCGVASLMGGRVVWMWRLVLICFVLFCLACNSRYACGGSRYRCGYFPTRS